MDPPEKIPLLRTILVLECTLWDASSLFNLRATSPLLSLDCSPHFRKYSISHLERFIMEAPFPLVVDVFLRLNFLHRDRDEIWLNQVPPIALPESLSFV